MAAYDKNDLMMGGTASVYGVEMSKRAWVPAHKFMHAQTSICFGMVVNAIVSLIFTILIMNQLKTAMETMSGVDQKSMPAAYATMEQQMEHYQWMGYISIVVAACVGGFIVAVARFIISERSDCGLCSCCILEGCCSCGAALQALVLIGYFVVFIQLLNSDIHKQLCDPNTHSQIAGWLQTTPSPSTAAAGSTGSTGVSGTQSDTVVQCEEWVRAMKTPFETCAIYLGVFSLMTCLQFCCCGAGSYFAHETRDAFEDEEYGGESDYY